MEKHLLKLLQTRAQWKKYDGLIDKYIISEEGKTIYRALSKFYNETDAQNVEWEPWASWFAVAHPMFRPEKQQTYATIIQGLGTEEPSNDETEASIVERLNRQYYSHRIAEHAIRGAEGDEEALEKVEGLLGEFKQSQQQTEQVEDVYVVGKDIHSLLQYASGEAGLDWRLEELNISCGPLRKGDLALIAARVHNGKTTLLVSEGGFMASQLKNNDILVWFNNEEAGERIKLRLIQSVIGCKMEFIQRDPDTAYKLYLDALGGKDRIVVYDRAVMSTKDVERFIEKQESPALLIFDQLHKVTGFEREDNSVFRLGKVFGRAKEWAKTYAPVFTSHQADGTAHGLLFPEGNQLAGARTDIQAELDLQIMMGKSFDMGRENIRGLNIVKNRLLGGPKTKPDMRHAKWEIQIQEEIGRFKGSI